MNMNLTVGADVGIGPYRMENIYIKYMEKLK